MTTSTITSFSGSYRFLSNFYPVPGGLAYDRLVFPTAEHAYQAMKTTDVKERQYLLDHSPTPAKAKSIGYAVTLRPDWEDIKIFVMYEILKEKFRFGGKLYEPLRATDRRQLIEGNTWGDTFWGMTYNKTKKKWQGQNWLGRILMAVRALG